MLIIHGVPLSVHTRKVIVTALLKGIAHRVDPVIPFDPPAGWRELSPNGLIPAISDGDFRIFDSAAICQYLDRTHPEPAILPAEPKALGRALALEAFAGGTLFRQVVHGLFFQKVIRPGMLQQPTDHTAVDAILTGQLPEIFGYLDGLADGPFLVGDRLTVADIAVASNLINYQYLGYRVDHGTYPRLAGHLARVLDKPALRSALAAERPFVERMGLDASFLG